MCTRNIDICMYIIECCSYVLTIKQVGQAFAPFVLSSGLVARIFLGVFHAVNAFAQVSANI